VFMQVRTPIGVRLKYIGILNHYLCAWKRRITIGEMHSRLGMVATLLHDGCAASLVFMRPSSYFVSTDCSTYYDAVPICHSA
jgi:hypothetical protein